jgi:hypothetical protein
MAAMVVLECGQKRLRLAHFQDDPMELVGRDGGALALRGQPDDNFCFQLRNMMLLRTNSNDVRIMAC